VAGLYCSSKRRMLSSVRFAMGRGGEGRTLGKRAGAYTAPLEQGGGSMTDENKTEQEETQGGMTIVAYLLIAALAIVVLVAIVTGGAL
jgi:hypothetical protein